MEYDFYIFTLPRSGSYMMASALDSHPNINCGGELFRKGVPLYGWLGSGNGIKGGIVNLINKQLIKNQKIIVLTRNPQDAIKSLDTQLDNGKYHAESNNVSRVRSPGKRSEKMYLNRVKEFEKECSKISNKLIVSYEEITNDESIDVIPEDIGKKICDFLKVDYRPLKPAFKKPKCVGLK